MKYLLAGVLLIYSVAGVASAATSADAVSYDYRSIDARYEVMPDSSIVVEERITVNYVGTYHSLWRGISLGSVLVSNVEVVDASTGEALTYVSRFPDDPNDPRHVGTYTWINDQGYFKVEWYYNAADITKTWVLRYTLRGAVKFLEDKDEFRWALFSRYAVPVDSSTIDIALPAPASPRGELTGTPGSVSQLDERTLRMHVDAVEPGGAATFAVEWHKGIVHPPLRAFVMAELFLTYGLWPLVVGVVGAAALVVYALRRRLLAIGR